MFQSLYETLYWAQELATQKEDGELKSRFESIASKLKENTDTILTELNEVKGGPADCGGYYLTDPAKVAKVTRSSQTLNAILAKLDTLVSLK